MRPSPVLKKLIVDQQYRPSLRVFKNMDDVGNELAPKFPIWSRGPLHLELRNTKKHQRLIVNPQQVIFEHDSPGTENERVEIITAVVKAYEKHLCFPEYSRFSVRGFFAAETQESFDDLLERFGKRFFKAPSDIPAFQGMKATDLGYVVDLVMETWKYTVRLGPMEKKQWFQMVQHERGIYDADDDAGSFARFMETIPERFLFMDIDAFRTEIDFRNAFERIRYLNRHICGLADNLTAYCWS